VLGTKRANEPWQLFVNSLAGQTRTISVNPSGFCAEIFDAIADREALAQEQIRLIYGGKQLDPDRLISDYGVQRGATIDLVWRMFGGAHYFRSPAHSITSGSHYKID
jgi:hypothetical protein